VWSIVYDKDGDRVILDYDNPKFYLCERFFTDEKYKTFSKLPIDEVVSVDTGLFPTCERILLDEEAAKTQTPVDGFQILKVRCVENEETFIETPLDGFDFCGFDLADDYKISALTNCGGFDYSFTCKNLNALGLLPDFLSARKIQATLKNKYPDEEHADCLMFAIWRKC